ncbi:MAG: electron transfer flavoprotein subunit beta/FixA family protein [Myxococcota bacterium]
MNIAVCAKVTPDTTAQIKTMGDGSGIETAGIKWVISPYDMFALTEAVNTTKSQGSGTVHLFTVGDDSDVSALRSGLALGGEDLTLVNKADLPKEDPLAVAKALARAIEAGPDIQMAFCGKQAADDDNVQVPAMVAEFLGWPLVSMISAFSVDGNTFTATRNVGGGVAETVTGSLPAVFTCDKGLNTPGYAKLPQIMKAKRKKVHKKSAADLGLSGDDLAASVSVSGYSAPPARPAGRMIEGDLDSSIAELVNLLRNEAKVL